MCNLINHPLTMAPERDQRILFTKVVKNLSIRFPYLNRGLLWWLRG